MRKSVTFIVLILSSLAFGQKIPKAEGYFVYFKTWNFIKYFHPDLASGKVNADSLFFRHLPEVEQVPDKKSFNGFVKNILSDLSVTQQKQWKEGRDILDRNRDFSWFEKSAILDKETAQQLSLVFHNRYSEEAHYFLPENNYTALLPHEKAYEFPEDTIVPSDYRMLALAKILGAVDYLYPHKYLMEQNFDELLKSCIVPALECEHAKDFETILLKLAASLQDSHSFTFYHQMKEKRAIFRNSFYPPFDYKVFDDGILVTNIIIPELCEAADLKTGDYITAINGQSIQRLINDLSQLLSVSNHQTLVHHLSFYPANLIWATEKHHLKLKVVRKDKKLSRTVQFLKSSDFAISQVNAYLVAQKHPAPEHDSLIILNRDIVYFNIHETFRFIENTPDAEIDRHMDSLMNLVRSKKGIIFDMRAYPDWGGFVYTYLPKHFAPALVPFAKYYEVNKQEVGTYVYKSSLETYYNADLKVNNAPYEGKVIILINPQTQSLSEWNTMCIQQLFPNSITIGDQSAGADGDFKTLLLPGGYELNFTGNAIFFKDGTEAQKKGVKIDRIIQQTKENFSSDTDYLLQQALDLMEKP